MNVEKMTNSAEVVKKKSQQKSASIVTPKDVNYVNAAAFLNTSKILHQSVHTSRLLLQI